MSKNLKDLIDKAEEEEKTKAQLEKTIESLELKVARLETKLEENRSPLNLEPAPQSFKETEFEEIDALKNVITAQNQELSQRNRDKEVLQKKVSELNTEILNLKESINDSIKDEVIMKTQNSLNNLIEDYGRLENTNMALKEKILQIEIENVRLRESVEASKTESSNIEQLEYDMTRLKKQLKDLEDLNKMLENRNLTLKNKEKTVTNLEKSIQDLDSLNTDLKQQNRELISKLNAVKAEKFQLTKFEAKASNLEKELLALRKENEELRQKDAILLANTINVMETHRRKPFEAPEYHEPANLKPEERAGLKMEEPFEILGTIEKTTEKEDVSMTLSNSVDTVDISPPDDLSLKDEMEKEESVTRKKTCPNCGNTNKAQIREFDDKTKILYTYPRIYAKMYRCGQCGSEWR